MNALAQVLEGDAKEVLDDWMRRQATSVTFRSDLIDEGTLRAEARQFLEALRDAAKAGGGDIGGQPFEDTREILQSLSRSRAQRGFTPRETAMFVFSLKDPLFTQLRRRVSGQAEALAEEMLRVSGLLDQLGLYTMEVFQQAREDIIVRQQKELLELSTPVVRLWDNVLALPLVGTLDSARTQVVMESLLQKIVDTGSAIAIIDITGVPTVDTLVAQHLLKTVAATRLMGADCIISGIRPQIAQTIVHLGVDLGEVTTKATLADAFAVALQRTGLSIASAAA
jgi:rsbT co-antagonist protein RsbR